MGEEEREELLAFWLGRRLS